METRANALARAKREGFNISSIVKSSRGGYFIAPHGIKTHAGKQAYAELRAKGNGKEKSARIAWSIEHKARNK